MSSLDDTICAVATPPGEGGIGIVRISGSQAFSLVSLNIRLRHTRSWDSLKPFRLYLAEFLEHPIHSGQGKDSRQRTVLDEVLVVIMKAPRSYTGEDVVEVHCHGGGTVVNAVCEALVGSGARLAEPGEFTKRAFLNGRLDLTQAEAVLDTIQATSLLSLNLAQEHLQGKLSHRLQSMRETLLRIVAHLEAGLDFAEEDIQFIDQTEIRSHIESIMSQISMLIDTSQEGRVIREGVRVVIVGPPNAGKSSLLNALLGTDRAIVSHIPGTTRDILEESIMVDGLQVRFFDTAGIRASLDELEREGMHRAQRMISQADVVVVVVDRSKYPNGKNLSVDIKNVEKQYIIVLNKSDLPHCISRDQAERLVEASVMECGKKRPRIEIVEVSARTGDGLPLLRTVIKQLSLGDRLESRDTVLVARLRHTTLLKSSREALKQALGILNKDGSPECLAMELRSALHSIGQIIGVVTDEEILDQIFRDFCIGK